MQHTGWQNASEHVSAVNENDCSSFALLHQALHTCGLTSPTTCDNVQWHYPQADLQFGDWGSFVSWVPWCYAFYTPALALLARHLWQKPGNKD